MRFFLFIGLLVGIATAAPFSIESRASSSVSMSGGFGRRPGTFNANAGASASISSPQTFSGGQVNAQARATASSSVSFSSPSSTPARRIPATGSATANANANVRSTRTLRRFRSREEALAFQAANPHIRMRIRKCEPTVAKDPCADLIKELEPCAPPPCVYVPPSCVVVPNTKKFKVSAKASSSVTFNTEEPEVTTTDVDGEPTDGEVTEITLQPTFTISGESRATTTVNGEVVDEEIDSTPPTTYTDTDGPISLSANAEANAELTLDAPEAVPTSEEPAPSTFSVTSEADANVTIDGVTQ